MSPANTDMLNSLGHSTSFHHILSKDQFRSGLSGLALSQQDKVKFSGVFKNIDLRYQEIAVGNPSIDK